MADQSQRRALLDLERDVAQRPEVLGAHRERDETRCFSEVGRSRKRRKTLETCSISIAARHSSSAKSPDSRK